MAPPLDPTPPAGESPEVYWFDFAAAIERAEPALKNAIHKVSQVDLGTNVEE
jgi:hypothetical protein